MLGKFVVADEFVVAKFRVMSYIVTLNKTRTPDFTSRNVKSGAYLVKHRFPMFLSGAYGTRTRDPMRDRHVF